MEATVKLYSDKEGEILRFLNKFYDNHLKNFNDPLLWTYSYQNPVEMADIIGTFIENKEDFKINMWISLDKNVFVNVTDSNADNIIRYLYERYPY